jgi:hypothetical protein
MNGGRLIWNVLAKEALNKPISYLLQHIIHQCNQ